MQLSIAMHYISILARSRSSNLISHSNAHCCTHLALGAMTFEHFRTVYGHTDIETISQLSNLHTNDMGCFVKTYEEEKAKHAHIKI